MANNLSLTFYECKPVRTIKSGSKTRSNRIEATAIMQRFEEYVRHQVLEGCSSFNCLTTAPYVSQINTYEVG